MNHNLRRDARFDRFFLDWLFGWITLAVAIGSSCRLQAADEGLPRSENSSFMTVTEPDITDETISRSYALDWWRLRPKLEKYMGQTNENRSSWEFLQDYLNYIELKLVPPKTMVMGNITSSSCWLWLKATRRELDAFEQNLRALGLDDCPAPLFACQNESILPKQPANYSEEMVTRLIRVDHTVFITALEDYYTAKNPSISRPVFKLAEPTSAGLMQQVIFELTDQACGWSQVFDGAGHTQIVDGKTLWDRTKSSHTDGPHVFYNHRMGNLLIRSKKSDIPTIKSLVSQMSTHPPWISLDVRFIQIANPAGERILKVLPIRKVQNNFTEAVGLVSSKKSLVAGNGQTTRLAQLRSKIDLTNNQPIGYHANTTGNISMRLLAVINDIQLSVVSKLLAEEKEADVFTVKGLIALNGATTQYEAFTGIKPFTKVLAKGISGNTAVMAPVVPLIVIVPVVAPDRSAIHLSLSLKMYSYDNHNSNLNGQYRTWLAEASVRDTIQSGQTMVFESYTDNPDGVNSQKDATGLVLVTATIVEAPGNRVRKN